eukprot:GHVN01071251.1.p1 GENE.GHVN01071251.1~~GHVN01071251.1.p1  ORF type:complete len:181 (-),score=23.25 GHVN01071251.1:295-837(-)
MAAKTIEKWNEKLRKTPPISKVIVPACNKCNLEPVPLCILTLGVLMLFTGSLAPCISYLIGMVYPAIASYKAIKTADKKDDTQWLSYWVVFSVLQFFETFFGFLFAWIPFFYFIKVAFLLYLSLFKGAETIYNLYVDPFASKHIDPDLVDKMTQDFKGSIAGAGKKAAELVGGGGGKNAD